MFENYQFARNSDLNHKNANILIFPMREIIFSGVAIVEAPITNHVRLRSVYPTKMPAPNSGICRAFAFAIGLFTFVPAFFAKGDSDVFKLDVGYAVETLKTFANQAGVSIVYDPRAVEGVETNEVVGEMEPREALRRMTLGTSLVFREDAETGAFAVMRPIQVEKQKGKTIQPMNDPMNVSNDEIDPKDPLDSERRPFIRKLKNFAAAALAAGATAMAPGQTDGGAEEAVFELSPFTVERSANEGYRATNTLAGTRLRTEMKDVAAPISIFTKELMEDVGADDLQEALLYSVNAENENEYAPDDTEGLSIGSTTQTRIRGISSPASQSRNFFRTEIRGDGYNTESFTVARGPNSVLFGLGSPSGVMDQTLKRASNDAAFGEFQLKFDSDGGHRQVLDYNYPVIGDKLSIRFAAMNQDRRTFRDPDFNKETRYFITSSLALTENTMLRVSYEDLDNDIVRGRSNLTNDLRGDHERAGSPIFNNGSGPEYGLWSWDGGATWREPHADSPTESWLVNNVLASSGQRIYIAGGGLGLDELQGNQWSGGRYSVRTGLQHTKTFSDGSILPTDINIRGLASASQLTGDVVGISLEHKFTDNLHLELAYNKESTARDSVDPLRATDGLQRDVNAFIPGTTSPNPNVGRYYIESRSSFLGWKMNNDYETIRATASYELDLTERNKWLGSHNFGLMFQEDDFEVLQIKTGLKNQGEEVQILPGQSYLDAVIATNSNILVRYYLDVPALGGDPDGVDVPGRFSLPPWNSIVGGISGDGRPTKSLQNLQGKMFVTQSKFLNESLVLTFGYRDDTERTYLANIEDRNPQTGEFIYRNIPYESEPITESGITRTYGAVYHTPIAGISAFFNKSDTFKPQGLYKDYFGDPLGPSTGSGEDYGISLDLMEGKLGGRISRFESNAANNIELDWFYEVSKWRVVNQMETWILSYNEDIYPLLGIDSSSDVFVDRPVIGDEVRSSRSFTSKGYEVELFARPIDNLDLRLTVAKTATVNSDVNAKLMAYVEERMPIYEKYFGLPTPDLIVSDMSDQIAMNPDDPNFQPDPLRYSLTDSQGNTVNAITPASGLSTVNTVGNRMYSEAERFPRLEAQKAVNGLKSDRLREWRVNLIANYRIQEGRFRGTSIGGAYRWRSAATIAYGGKPNPLGDEFGLVEDLDRPFNGPEESNYDFWASYSKPINLADKEMIWKIQLNIQNAFTGHSDVFVTDMDLNGNPFAYAMNPPRVFSLTNTLSF